VKIDRVAVNASPLIVLFNAQLADLLPQLFAEVLVPSAVWNEVTASDASDAAAQQLPFATWAKRIEVTTIPPIVSGWNLGQGESEVLSLAIERSECRAMLDDAAARRCARTLGVPTLGTGGALILAKRRGLVASVSASIQTLRDAGLWMSDEVMAILLKQAGE
jgi:predicted nucleic acid-binding protein